MTFLSLLATVLLMLPRMSVAFCAARAHCWLMFNLLSTRTSRSLSAKLASWSPAWIVAWAYSFPDARLRISFCLTHEVVVSPFLQHVKIPLNSSLTLQHIYHCPQFATMCELLERALRPIIHDTDVKNNIEQYTLYLYIHIYCYNIGTYIV